MRRGALVISSCSCGVKQTQIDGAKIVKHRRGASLGIATWWQSGTRFEGGPFFRSSTCFRSWTGKQRRGPRIRRPQCLRREENPSNCETTHGGVESTWTTTFELLGIGRCRFINLRASPSESTAMETQNLLHQSEVRALPDTASLCNQYAPRCVAIRCERSGATKH